MSICSPYAESAVTGGMSRAAPGTTADIDHRADRGRCEHAARPAETDRIRLVGVPGLPR
jgi:hypothetical protein